ncbi:MAG: response regulator [Planctomycetes bacterium]|nr:response regulator [Planctomycetota bacterium]
MISDWQMQTLDGLGLCRLIRARPARQYSYLILITSHGAMENYQAGIKAGADDFLQKPFDESYLAARLIVAERIVGMQNHTRQLESLMSVCSYCKSIRNDSNQWVSMENYASTQFGVRSSHGICPCCFNDRVKPEMERLGINVDALAAP